MNVLPNGPVDPGVWAQHAWSQSGEALALTVPASALKVLLDAYVELHGLEESIRQSIRVTVETGAKSPKENAPSP